MAGWERPSAKPKCSRRASSPATVRERSVGCARRWATGPNSPSSFSFSFSALQASSDTPWIETMTSQSW